MTSATASSDAGAEAADGSATPSACPASCAPAVPEGWLGPNAVHAGPADTALTCADPYPRLDVAHAYHLTELAHSCACTTTVENPRCGFQLSAYTGGACDGTMAHYFVGSGGGCSATGSPVPSSLKASDPVFFGTCSKPVLAEDKPPPFDRQFVACGRDTRVTCAGRADCVEAPEPMPAGIAQLCIRKDGTQDCPVSYPARTVVTLQYTDSRTCTPCASSAAPASTPEPCRDILVYAGMACGAPSIGSAKVGECVKASAESVVMNPAADIKCVATGGERQGELTPNGTLTFCCMN